MDSEGPYANRKTARMAISLEGFCSWTITQDPTQQETQKNTFFTWYGRDWMTRPTAPILPHQTFTFSLNRNQHYRTTAPWGRLATTSDSKSKWPHTRRIFSEIGFRTLNPLTPKPRPYYYATAASVKMWDEFSYRLHVTRTTVGQHIENL
ncbi:hypothetical protein AVEN_97186-1 [Araneus ventricosus]|uniref:Uncharacterized protein n=1 Tax=Araneus ventricosus TaxID=182803 RepID=A0A4Y2DF65_ARAVE|nr:hypothetical protein AVEN_97186-1 [Araneus ventricosus]